VNHLKKYEEINCDKFNLVKKHNYDKLFKIIKSSISHFTDYKSEIQKEDNSIILKFILPLEKIPEITRINNNINGVTIIISFNINSSKMQWCKINFNFIKNFYPQLIGSFYQSNIGVVDVYKTFMSLEISHNTIIKSKEQLISIINSNIENLVTYLNNCSSNLDIKKQELDNKIKIQKEIETQRKNFLSDKEDIIECFSTLMDISDSYDISDNGNSISIVFNINGVNVFSQTKSKSSYVKYSSVHINFDEAHLDVNDELINVLSSIIEAKAHLKAINPKLSVKTIFKKNSVNIIIQP
jgi:hypothetical protein